MNTCAKKFTHNKVMTLTKMNTLTSSYIVHVEELAKFSKLFKNEQTINVADGLLDKVKSKLSVSPILRYEGFKTVEDTSKVIGHEIHTGHVMVRDVDKAKTKNINGLEHINMLLVDESSEYVCPYMFQKGNSDVGVFRNKSMLVKFLENNNDNISEYIKYNIENQSTNYDKNCWLNDRLMNLDEVGFNVQMFKLLLQFNCKLVKNDLLLPKSKQNFKESKEGNNPNLTAHNDFKKLVKSLAKLEKNILKDFPTGSELWFEPVYNMDNKVNVSTHNHDFTLHAGMNDVLNSISFNSNGTSAMVEDGVTPSERYFSIDTIFADVVLARQNHKQKVNKSKLMYDETTAYNKSVGYSNNSTGAVGKGGRSNQFVAVVVTPVKIEGGTVYEYTTVVGEDLNPILEGHILNFTKMSELNCKQVDDKNKEIQEEYDKLKDQFLYDVTELGMAYEDMAKVGVDVFTIPKYLNHHAYGGMFRSNYNDVTWSSTNRIYETQYYCDNGTTHSHSHQEPSWQQIRLTELYDNFSNSVTTLSYMLQHSPKTIWPVIVSTEYSKFGSIVETLNQIKCVTNSELRKYANHIARIVEAQVCEHIMTEVNNSVINKVQSMVGVAESEQGSYTSLNTRNGDLSHVGDNDDSFTNNELTPYNIQYNITPCTATSLYDGTTETANMVDNSVSNSVSKHSNLIKSCDKKLRHSSIERPTTKVDIRLEYIINEDNVDQFREFMKNFVNVDQLEQLSKLKDL